MNFQLPYLPERSEKPRESGLTMVMDKGLSLRQVEDLIESSGHLIDLVKLGFGTSYVTPNLKEKITLYHQNNIRCYLGGTLFEAFIVRGMFDDYRKLLDDYGLSTAEVSDGAIALPMEDKCNYIRQLAEQVTVLSEVGSKMEDTVFTPSEWVKMMNTELEAGSWKVIAEARESGKLGIYDSAGQANTGLIQTIMSEVPTDKVLWEAPVKPQQVWFINLLGSSVNLGNIAPHDVIPLETLRLGLRGDTFFSFLPEALAQMKP
mgnify:CR=1 FL=1